MKQLLVIIFATVLAYLNIFNNQLVVDDHIFVGKYSPSLTEAFSGVVPATHEGVYRPVRGLFFTVYSRLWGSNPLGYHLNSLLVHLISTVLVYFIVKSLILNFKLQTSGGLPFVAALLFGLHPVHTETITYIASGMDSIGLVFFLAAFYCYLRGKIIASLALALAAFFTTEMSLTLPLFIIFYDWVAGKLAKNKITVYGWFGTAAALYLIVRFTVLHITTRGPYLAGSFYLTMLTMTKVVLQYLKVLLWPVNLMSNHIISPGIEAFVYRNYRTAAIAAQSIFDVEILLSAVVISILIWLIWRLQKSHPLISFGIGTFFLGLLPVMELVPQGSMMNERFLYISSFGLVLITAFVILQLKNKKLIIFLTCLLVIFYGARTISRNRDWHDDISLWQADVNQSPTENAYTYFALGNAYNDRKEYKPAIEQYAKSVEINPGFAVGWASLGRTYADMGKTAEAIANYKQALAIDPDFQEVKINLSNIYQGL